MNASVHQTEDLLFSILVQLIVMIGAARLLHSAFRAIRQPGVVGEIVAGLLLGPSLVGSLFPAASRAIFGETATTSITIISQIGLILLMFQIGMDFEFAHLRTQRNRRALGLVTALSVGVPLVLGLLVGLASAPRLAPGIDRTTYSLFFGVGMAITAVPVLGRILRQYGLTRTEVGVVAISAAALNDVVGWLLLAAVSAYASARLSTEHIALQVGGFVLFAAVLWWVLRPAANWLIGRFPARDSQLPPNLMAVLIGLAFALGIATYSLGIFSIFGGFAAGLLFHHHREFVALWHRQVGQFVTVFFLPVFFTYTGLRTNVLGLSTVEDLTWLAIVLAAAVLGKILPVYLAGRLTGFDHHESAILGTLMNTRALMELVVLNIGFDLGFIPAKVFTMLVIMAVVTTVMTGPILRVLLPRIGHALPEHVEA